jgi:hypothetical protein
MQSHYSLMARCRENRFSNFQPEKKITTRFKTLNTEEYGITYGVLIKF